jgi:hypothetical protein
VADDFVTVRAAELLEQAEALAEKATDALLGVVLSRFDNETGNWECATFRTDRLEGVEECVALVPALAARLRDALTVVEAARRIAQAELASEDAASVYSAFLRLRGEARERIAVFDAGPAAVSGRLVLTSEQADVLREFLESAAVFCDDTAVDDDTDVAIVNLVEDLARVEALGLFDAGPAAAEEEAKPDAG